MRYTILLVIVWSAAFNGTVGQENNCNDFLKHGRSYIMKNLDFNHNYYANRYIIDNVNSKNVDLTAIDTKTAFEKAFSLDFNYSNYKRVSEQYSSQFSTIDYSSFVNLNILHQDAAAVWLECMKSSVTCSDSIAMVLRQDDPNVNRYTLWVEIPNEQMVLQNFEIKFVNMRVLDGAPPIPKTIRGSNVPYQFTLVKDKTCLRSSLTLYGVDAFHNPHRAYAQVPPSTPDGYKAASASLSDCLRNERKLVQDLAKSLVLDKTEHGYSEKVTGGRQSIDQSLRIDDPSAIKLVAVSRDSTIYFQASGSFEHNLGEFNGVDPPAEVGTALVSIVVKQSYNGCEIKGVDVISNTIGVETHGTLKTKVRNKYVDRILPISSVDYPDCYLITVPDCD